MLVWYGAYTQKIQRLKYTNARCCKPAKEGKEHYLFKDQLRKYWTELVT